jgi:hypothetical protein
MPDTAMRRYALWLKALPGKPVFAVENFVAYSSAHDQPKLTSK